MEHFKAVEAALYEATGFQEEASRAQLVAALTAVDPELTDKQVRGFVAFNPERLNLKALKRRPRTRSRWRYSPPWTQSSPTSTAKGFRYLGL